MSKHSRHRPGQVRWSRLLVFALAGVLVAPGFAEAQGGVDPVAREVIVTVDPVAGLASVDLRAFADGFDDDELTWLLTELPSHGKAGITVSTLVYVPDPGWSGQDVGAYSVSGADGRTAVGRFVIDTPATPAAPPTSGLPTQPADEPAPESPQVEPKAAVVSLSAPETVQRGAQVVVFAQVADASGAPLAEAVVTFQADGQPLGVALADNQGVAALTARFDSVGPRAITAASAGGVSAPAVLTVVATVTVTALSGPAVVPSEGTVTYDVRVAEASTGSGVAGASVTIWQAAAGASWARLGVVTTDSTGRAVFPFGAWRGMHQLAAEFSGSATEAPSRSAALTVSAAPGRAAVPVYGPQPAAAPPPAPPAVGAGANPVVEAIPEAVWARMVGVSWQPGCPVGRDRLRYVTVNYWGYDGFRHRGELVVNQAIAESTGRAFATLHDLGYPIRQMRLADDFGRGPYRGANDYAAMSAGNTSGFNCRFVVGRERQRAMSPHAYGTAIDVNPWENPYSARTGMFPNREWFGRHGHISQFAIGSQAVAAFTTQGFAWGGTWRAKDLHHFQAAPAAKATKGKKATKSAKGKQGKKSTKPRKPKRR